MSSRQQNSIGIVMLGAALIGATLVVTACGAAAPSNSAPSSEARASATVAGSSRAVVTLRIGVTGGTFDAQAPHLIDTVAALSSGGLRIEPAPGWDITGTHREAEQEIIKAVAAGDLDLGLVGTRSLSAMGVTAFDALIAPMLIDTYPLERAVLDTDIPAKMLTTLDELGVKGLAVIGGALRFPSGVDAPFLGPQTYSGRTFHVFNSAIGTATIDALGATATDAIPEERDVGLADGSINGLENSMSFLAGKPAFARHTTVNVPFWPATGVLVASPAMMATLDDQQTEWLRAAVADTAANALDLLVDDQESVRSICDQGGEVYQASSADLVAMKKAVQPVYDHLNTDADTAAFISQIAGLKESIRPQPLVVPDRCGGADTGVDARLPDGTYRTDVLSSDDVVAALRARGVAQSAIDTFVGSDIAHQTYTITYKFDAGRFVQLEESDGSEEVGSSGTFKLLDDSHLEINEPCCGTSQFQFSLDGGTLRLRADVPDEDIQGFCVQDPSGCAGFLRVVEAGPFVRQP
jgi:TRAP-type C4-dicarboxylate transport system substrate-binding protein